MRDGVSGVHPDYGHLYDRRHDLLFEAGVPAVSEQLLGAAEHFGTPLRLERDVPPERASTDGVLVTVFRLAGQSWSQVFYPGHPRRPFHLARTASDRLQTRCLQLEASDDAWGGHALYQRDRVLEVAWSCVGDDLPRLGNALGLEVPFSEATRYQETTFVRSQLRSATEAHDLEALARQLGLWIDAGPASWGDGTSVERCDLLFTA